MAASKCIYLKEYSHYFNNGLVLYFIKWWIFVFICLINPIIWITQLKGQAFVYCQQERLVRVYTNTRNKQWTRSVDTLTMDHHYWYFDWFNELLKTNDVFSKKKFSFSKVNNTIMYTK